jgi:NTE family protein
METKQTYKNLVLEGSGMNGLSYIGVVKVLEDRKIINQIENFAGSSSGAIVAAFLSIGYTSQELLYHSRNIKWKNLVKKCFFPCFQFWKNYGLFKYTNIETTIQEFFQRKIGKKDITFKEHFLLTGKKLIITSVNINRKYCEYFSKDTTPDLSVIQALKMSTAFPFIFDAVKYNNMLYVDGGVMNNFAIEYFGHRNPETLGINLIDSHKNSADNVDNILKFGINIVHSIYNSQKQSDKDYEINNVIFIDIENTNVVNSIIMMSQDIDILYNAGIKCATKYFDNIDSLNPEHSDD